MTKAQRSEKAKRAGRKRAKQAAAVKLLSKMNPALVRRMKKGTVSDVVRIKRLAGGGVSVTPVKGNRGLGHSRRRYWAAHPKDRASREAQYRYKLKRSAERRERRRSR